MASTRKTAKKETSRKALGRGLSSLMRSTMVEVDVGEQLKGRSTSGKKKKKAKNTAAQTAPATAAPEQKDKTAEVASDESGLRFVAIHRLVPNPDQPRKEFPEGEIESLAQSIKQSGVLQPILVRPRSLVSSDSHSAGNVDGFEIIAGERRFRAAKRAGLRELPCVVRTLSNQEALEIGIVENVQRSDLSPLEVATAYKRLLDEFGLSQEDVAQTVGKDRTSVANAIRLLRLPVDLQDMLAVGSLSAGHGRALLMLEDERAQRKLAKRILEDQLSVRESERLASGKADSGTRGARGGRKASKEKKSAIELQLEERFRRGLGTKVDVSVASDGKGELRISFFSREELDRLIEYLDV